MENRYFSTDQQKMAAVKPKDVMNSIALLKQPKGSTAPEITKFLRQSNFFMRATPNTKLAIHGALSSLCEQGVLTCKNRRYQVNELARKVARRRRSRRRASTSRRKRSRRRSRGTASTSRRRRSRRRRSRGTASTSMRGRSRRRSRGTASPSRRRHSRRGRRRSAVPPVTRALTSRKIKK
ncbi:hypothetical protein PR048_002261 [Dryococelus australis]|uniref:H15 domain-containing protein n=1 Tax=Dryococelus australis TaxID=614101 RepID=A0ABQ9IJP3_9NEOP|nr:hypothetical protein PR048_002261 [Dryococelus australis]